MALEFSGGILMGAGTAGIQAAAKTTTVQAGKNIAKNASYNNASENALEDSKTLITGEDWNNYFRETYGYDNINWESAFDSPNEIIDMPSSVTRMNPEGLNNYLSNNGWNVEALGRGQNAGISFSDGGGFSARTVAENGNLSSNYIQYNPSSSHHDGIPYYKVSSGKGIFRYFIEKGE